MISSGRASMDPETRRLHPLGVPVALSVRVDRDGSPVEVREGGGGSEHGRNAAMQRVRGDGRTRKWRGGERPHARGVQRSEAVQIKTRGARIETRAIRIEAIQEIWQVDDEWWRTPLSRLYYRVVLENGRLMILFRDLVDGTWYRQ